VPEDSVYFIAGLLLHVGGTDKVQEIPQMVNVPIGGPEVQFRSGQDVNMSPKGDSFQSYLLKMRDNGTGHSMLGSDFLANSPPPREVVTKRELMHNQHNGAQVDRCTSQVWLASQVFCIRDCFIVQYDCFRSLKRYND